MNNIRILSGEINIKAELNETHTAKSFYELLPLEGEAIRWGDEIYFEIPLEMDRDKEARAEVDVGELGYWSVGQAFCIFFGPTPISKGEQPLAYSPVNIIGRVLGDATKFKSVQNGDQVKIESIG